jgi:hypothetical protein
MSLSPAGYWLAGTPRELWPDLDDEILLTDWREPWGDRRQEIVFIGQEMDQEEIIARLDSALLSESEMASGPEGWSGMEDPIPDWGLPGSLTHEDAVLAEEG